MARVAVTDPAGTPWRVWRRWYAWRRWVTFGDLWRAIPGNHGDRYGNTNAIEDAESFVLFILVLLGLVASLLDLAAQLIALPFILLARVVRLAAWPVQSDRDGKFVRTQRVRGFGRAAALRDELVEQVRSGTGVAAQTAEAAG